MINIITVTSLPGIFTMRKLLYIIIPFSSPQTIPFLLILLYVYYLFISLSKSSISSKPSCNVAIGSRFDIDSIESSPESILATEKVPIECDDPQIDGQTIVFPI
jgi:hypothetical protein